MSDSHSDALVFFGATGDLAYKKIFPALQAMIKRGHLDVPVIKELKGAQRPAHYLAIPPLLFGTVVEQLARSGSTQGARVIIEKPFGNDLASAQELNSVQITMAEEFGVQGRGAFYDQTGTIRDVIQNHLFQVLCNLAMEPPVRTDSETIRDEKVKVLKAIPPLQVNNLV